jgi:radical SAM superfamily enzyme YgiQ (UPF0313 family)
VYKGAGFEKRTEDDVIKEIDLLADAAEQVCRKAGILFSDTRSREEALTEVVRNRSLTYEERRVALWLNRGASRVFLQDADSLVRPAYRIEKILRHLYRRFPTVTSVCTYARSRTLIAKSKDDLKALFAAGLTRIHIGVESGSDSVLRLVQKGCTSKHHIEGIGRAIDAGFEVCCYVMPGLGGRALSDEHVEGTARVLKVADPHVVRLRTMFLSPFIPLFENVKSGEMSLLEEDEVILEIRKLLSMLQGCRGRLVSDHEYNLLMNIQGHLTDDKEELDRRLLEFLELPKDLQDGFIAARRSGRLCSLSHFLSDEAGRAEMAGLAQALRRTGNGSLLKGIMDCYSPRLF